VVQENPRPNEHTYKVMFADENMLVDTLPKFTTSDRKEGREGYE
jgi:hypothetical protein